MPNIITEWSTFFITDAGLRLRQQSIATGEPVSFDYAKIGQGTPTNPANIPNMTDIISASEQVPVVRSISDGVTHHVGVRIDNSKFKLPVLMTEIGLFASIGGDEPILYGYTYATQGYDSIPAGKVSHYVWTVGIDTVLSRAQNISFTYDGSDVYASEEEIDSLIQSFEEFKDNVTNQLDDFSPPCIVNRSLLIPSTSAVWNQGADGGYADVPVEGVTASMIPIVSVAESDSGTASKCGLSSKVETLDGAVRFHAKRTPEADITAELTLLVPSGSIPGGLPGGSAKLIEELSASDSDVQEVINGIFVNQK